jgi:DNA N-6-adenine-methyltransferase (Dam)
VTGTNGGRPRKYATDAERAKAYRQRKRAARLAQTISVHFRHDTVAWETPKALFEALDSVFHFTTDVCADASNAKCPHYFTEAQDGLRQRWEGTCFMNPRMVRTFTDGFRKPTTARCMACWPWP